MKKILIVIGILFLVSSCERDTENTMTVTGKIKGLKKGTLYLQYFPDSVLVTLDSLQIMGNEDFTFKTEIESPELFYLYLNKNDNNDINDRLPFFGEPGMIKINTNWNTFVSNAKITGSKSQEKLEEYQKTMSELNKKSFGILQMANNLENPLNDEEIDSLERVNLKNIQRRYLYGINFAINNKDSYVAPYIAVKEIQEVNIKYLDSILGILPPEVAASKYGRELKEYIEKNKNK